MVRLPSFRAMLCADIPNPADAGARKNRALQTGVPHEKLQFVITPLRQLSAQIGDELASRFIMGTVLSYASRSTCGHCPTSLQCYCQESRSRSWICRSQKATGVHGSCGGEKKKKVKATKKK